MLIRLQLSKLSVELYPEFCAVSIKVLLQVGPYGKTCKCYKNQLFSAKSKSRN